jgi:basic membrane protein A
MKKATLVISILLLGALLISACAPKAKTGMKFCEVTDVGGIDDKSFNALAWSGMERAAADFGVEVKYLESQQQSDYETNINAFIDEGCDLIVSVGFLLSDATKAAAEANPEKNFAIIDNDYMEMPNVRGNFTNINEATFLAGYLSAGMTETGKVGCYVGILFPATQAFCDGYVKGVDLYNEVHGTTVEVLGADPATGTYLEVGNFESLDDGRAFGETLLDEGADIIMPVAGPVGLGTLAVLAERGEGLLIGVDSDWAVANPDKADYVLANALKKIDTFVYDSVDKVIKGEFAGGENYILTLENNGAALGYSSTWEDKIPAELKTEIEELVPLIVSGEVATLP